MCFAFIGIKGTKQIEKTLRDLHVTTEALWQLRGGRVDDSEEGVVLVA